jgi:hypothetical protein
VFGRDPGATGSELAGPRADVEALLGRLGHDVSTLDDGGDPINRQTLADASERFNTASAQLNRAVTLSEIAVARSVALEGIHSARFVRTRLGLDPGSDPSLNLTPAEDPHTNPHQPGLGGLGGALGTGAAAGVLGFLGGSLLGEVLGGFGDDGDRDDGGWGGD